MKDIIKWLISITVLISIVLVIILMPSIIGVYNYLTYVQHNSKEINRIYISEDIYNTLKLNYASKSDEFAVCLDGEYANNSLIITKLVATKNIASDEFSIRFLACDTIAYLHSHPNGMCALSDQDLVSFGMQNINSDEKLQWSGIICGSSTKKIVFFNIENLNKKPYYVTLYKV